MIEVTIYSTNFCPYCVRAKNLLKNKGKSFVEINVSGNSDLRAEMVSKSGGRRTVPQIFIGDRHIGGFDDMAKLDRDGGLDPLLEQVQNG